MNTKNIISGAVAVLILPIVFGLGAVAARAAISYGSGYYTNLCGGGTSANFYNCDPGCNPATGQCTGSNNGVVKYTCVGRWDQCLESESNWANQQSLGNPSCGTTVQISLFDKKCRAEDGTWDPTCHVEGYMVWYSGDCAGNVSVTPTGGVAPSTSPSVSATPSPTVRPSATPRPQATPTPILSNSPTGASKFSTPKPTVRVTVSPTPRPGGVCGKSCTNDASCPAGFGCFQGVCRNPSCPTDSSCFCGNGFGESIADKPPKTGVTTWVLGGAIAAVGVVGWKLTQLSRKIW